MQQGLVKQAHGGTLFLDEINEMKYELQPKILRFLEDRSFLPVGSVTEHFSDLRIIAASNQNLKKLLDEGKFRSDLYYRIKMLEIQLKPLRERQEDILPLAEFFVAQFCSKHGIPLINFSINAKKRMMKYHWPGNVRELRNIVFRAIAHGNSKLIQSADLGIEVRHKKSNPGDQDSNIKSLKDIEKEHILAVYKKSGFIIRKTARLLGIDRNTLKSKLKEYGVFSADSQ